MDGDRAEVRLRVAEMTDSDFDALYAARWRKVSLRYWTPIDVAVLAASWLTEAGAKRVLDVGAGVGKLCVVGASVTDATFVGIEQRYSLVAAARSVAQTAGVEDRTLFLHAEASLPLMRGYSAIYLFNPFGENLYSSTYRLDGDVELGQKRYCRDVWLVEEVLRLMPIGGRVVTYHGFGGRIPDGMVVERERGIGSDTLRLWVKKSDEIRGYFVETETGVAHLPGRAL